MIKLRWYFINVDPEEFFKPSAQLMRTAYIFNLSFNTHFKRDLSFGCYVMWLAPASLTVSNKLNAFVITVIFETDI